MCTTFTEHIRAFGPDCDLVSCVLPRLERVLRRQMLLRQLLSAPPAYLGYPEYPTWNLPDAFEELVADCYLFAIARRIVGLRNQLRARPDIDGLITVNVRNFLFERQRKSDAAGYATFGNVEQAVRLLVEQGEATAVGRGDGRLDGDSVIQLGTGAPTAPIADRAALQSVLDSVPGWSAALLDLIATTEAGQGWVAGYLRALSVAGVARVRVSDIVNVLATRVRTDWDARNATPAADIALEGGDTEFVQTVRLAHAELTLDDRDRWEMWKRTVPSRIAQVEPTDLRERLTAEFAAVVALIEAGESPAQADLIRRLGFSRSTVSRDFAHLREILSEIAPPAGSEDGSHG